MTNSGQISKPAKGPLAAFRRAWGDECFEMYPLDKFTDPTVTTAYQKVSQDFEAVKSSTQALDQLLKQASDARGDSDRATMLRSACIYLYYAQQVTDHDLAEDPKITAEKAFHFAANELRKLDVLDRSAQCYFNSAVRALNLIEQTKAKPSDKRDEALEFSIRSAGRARALYASLGDDDRTDKAHKLRQELVRFLLRFQGKKQWMLLYLWKVITGYGVSVRRWFTAVCVTIVSFAVLYGILHWKHEIDIANNASYICVITPLHLSILNLLQFGSYTQIVPLHWPGQVVVTLQGIIAFILVGTGVTFLTKK